MQVSGHPHDLDSLRTAWRKFIEGSDPSDEIDPLVAESWHRCRGRLDPRASPRWSYAGAELFASESMRYGFLRLTAQPVMEDAYQFLEGSGSLLVLTGASACIYRMLGDPEVDEYARGLGFMEGAYLEEGRVGTNAFSLALLEGVPAQTIGAEHFLEFFHDMYAAAAPIHDSMGNELGSIGILQQTKRYSPSSWGVAVAAARAVESQLRADRAIRDANAQVTEFNATLDAVSDGIIAWNDHRIITHLNRRGGELLALKPSLVVGRPIADHVTLPENFARAVAEGEELNEVESTLLVDGVPRDFLVSLHIVRHAEAGVASFIATLRPIAQVHRLVTRLVGAQARLTLDDVVGRGEAAQELGRRSLDIESSNKPLLVVGERGTGKNQLARAIHNDGGRAGGPFLAIDCRAMPRELALGELCGYEAPVPARHDTTGQPSKFELAADGTLFLDDVDALPLETQAALARIISSSSVVRVGGKRAIPIDVRVIASTEADPARRVEDGSFDRSLYSLFEPLVVRIPPLRERKEDIPLLLERTLERLRPRFGSALSISDEAADLLRRYSWPGNTAEFDSVLERAALAAGGGLIVPEMLHDSIRQAAADEEGGSNIKSLDRLERESIIQAIRVTGGNLSRAASGLGISRNTLYRKLRELDIQQS